jgi:hypothetical protein
MNCWTALSRRIQSAGARVFAECLTDDHHPITAAKRRQRYKPQKFNRPVTQHHLFRFNMISQRERSAQARLIVAGAAGPVGGRNGAQNIRSWSKRIRVDTEVAHIRWPQTEFRELIFRYGTMYHRFEAPNVGTQQRVWLGVRHV